MNRVVITMFVCGLVFAGFEGAADAVGLVVPSELHDAHDLHSQFAHAADAHDHADDGEEEHGHYCHCTVHGAALLPDLAELNFSKADCGGRPHRVQASSRGDPPLIRPPIA